MVIEPADVWAVLTLPERRIDVFAKRVIDESDVVTNDAITTFVLTTATARALASLRTMTLLVRATTRICGESRGCGHCADVRQYLKEHHC